MAKKVGASVLIDRQGCSKPYMSDTEYRRLLKILTARACRVLKVAMSYGEDWLLPESGKSPADFAAETLIRWGTDQLRFIGPPEALPGFLMTVMTNAIISTLRKPAVKTGRGGKMTPADELTEDTSPQSKPENLFDICSLLRDDAFRAALNQCTADDKDLKEYVEAVEMFEDGIPAARDLGSMALPSRAAGGRYEEKERGESPREIVRGKSGSAVWTRGRPHRC
jgi:DNA-directed RNA polymerase specialized sigma24 family protein